MVRMSVWIGCVIALGACRGQFEDEAPVYDPTTKGPYTVGATTIDWVDSRGKALTAEIWYPAVPGEGDTPDAYELPLVLDAYRAAPPDLSGAPYDLIAFSHGLGGVRYQSASLCEYLASHGYVIVSPDHPGSILINVDMDNLDTITLERPGDVIAAVDELIRLTKTDDPLLAGITTGDEYAMVGHSFGAVTTLVVGGGELDLPSVIETCEGQSNIVCRAVSGITPERAAEHVLVDERITATVPMSPGAAYAFGSDGSGLAALPATLVLGGTKDDVLPYDSEIRLVYDGLDDPKTLATYKDAGHYAPFSDMCRLIPVFGDCLDEGQYLDAELGRQITHHLVTAFLGQQYRGQEAYGEWLAADVLSQFEPLTMESQ